MYYTNQNLGYPHELFTYSEDNWEVTGVLSKPLGEDVTVRDFTLFVAFEDYWFQIKDIPDAIKHKYEEILISKWVRKLLPYQW